MKNLGFIINLPFLILLTFCKPKVNEERKVQVEEVEENGSQSHRNSSSDTLMKIPQPTQLRNFKQTDFSLTLENPIAENRNIIYTPTFLYAWEKVKQNLNLKILSNEKNSEDFKLLNQSNSYLNSLNKEEYSSEVSTEGTAIRAKTIFFKTLPFETEFEKLDDPILFNNKEVKAFGMYFFNENIVKNVQILQYKDDDHFVLKLLPKEKGSEFILVKGLKKDSSLKAALNETNNLIKQGNKELQDKNNAWKYQIIRGERISIPTIKFNIETNYKTLEGQVFKTSDEKEHFIEMAYQRTGFILNERGAVIESESIVTTDSIGAQPIIPHFKKLVFDKPFYLMIKRAGQPNPSFLMKIANTELLTAK